MQKRKFLFAASVLIISFILISVVGAEEVSFSVTVTPTKPWPGETVNVIVNTKPECVGTILIWKPFLYEEPIGDWCEFLEVFYEHPEAMILTADILIFDGNGIEAGYSTTWEETTNFDPYDFDPCDPPELPTVLWNEDWEDCQEHFYGEFSGPNTFMLGKYFVVVFATDGEWVELLLENICDENWDNVYELICNPTWVGAFITSFLVIPELFLGTVTAVATPILAFTTMDMLRRKRRHTK